MVHEAENNAKHKCPRCRSGHVDLAEDCGQIFLICLDCGYEDGKDQYE